MELSGGRAVLPRVDSPHPEEAAQRLSRRTRALSAVFPRLDPQNFRAHWLHHAERAWPETNCYVDLLIEAIAAKNFDPLPAMAFTVTQDFEGDQIGFFKFPTGDLETLYGFRIQELAIFDCVEEHIAQQVSRGRLCLIELDSFFLPDTQGVTYRRAHGKTTVGVNRIDIARRRLEYFHNAGYFALEGEDFDGLFRRGDFAENLFLPYTEMVKFDPVPDQKNWLGESLALLRRHVARMPERNPVAAFAEVFADQARRLEQKPEGFFHTYAFNTLRQLGANFGLLAEYTNWLEAHGESGLTEAAEAATQIADAAKVAQFQLARALARRRYDALTNLLLPAAESWETLAGILRRRYG
jgi:hypothetical protein